MDGWNTTFLLGRPIFRCYVSFREGNTFDFEDSGVPNSSSFSRKIYTSFPGSKSLPQYDRVDSKKIPNDPNGEIAFLQIFSSVFATGTAKNLPETQQDF